MYPREQGTLDDFVDRSTILVMVNLVQKIFVLTRLTTRGGSYVLVREEVQYNIRSQI